MARWFMLMSIKQNHLKHLPHRHHSSTHRTPHLDAFPLNLALERPPHRALELALPWWWWHSKRDGVTGGRVRWGTARSNMTPCHPSSVLTVGVHRLFACPTAPPHP